MLCEEPPETEHSCFHQLFLNILMITKHRLSHVMKNFATTGQAPVEQRGGRKALNSKIKKLAVQNFNKFKGIESKRFNSKAIPFLGFVYSKKKYKMYDEQSSAERGEIIFGNLQYQINLSFQHLALMSAPRALIGGKRLNVVGKKKKKLY
ncbi:hypothetical protein JTB14_030913 [Gonioctena quinquepunctata]|nr:hypothetical protein JTB14_030913 [Gonioctena quinquepunctata]